MRLMPSDTQDIFTDLDYLATAHFSKENGAHNDTVPKTTTPSSGAPLDETDKFDAASSTLPEDCICGFARPPHLRHQVALL
ncbi:hypothetical protein QE152_g37507 [Popillia japonica]|uniref:Uncharacterized protein n=1 Tax=Popillia japonica TaxID=7064 RepID=A0AAW1I9N3_POPJA